MSDLKTFSPTNFDEAMKFAHMIANSDLAPKDYKGKPDNVFVAMQMGAELGIQPMAALQNIAVINGRPSIWGDAALALVLSSPKCQDVIETADATSASCTAIRKGQEPRTYTFSIEDAKRANLWGKQGPWTNYPTRMLQMRARGFALRDKFADLLKGLVLAEEAMDIPPEKDITPAATTPTIGAAGVKAKMKIAKQQEVPLITVESIKKQIEEADTAEKLIAARNASRTLSKNDRELVREVYEPKFESLKKAYEIENKNDSSDSAQEFFGANDEFLGGQQ